MRTEHSLWENAAFYRWDGKHQIITGGTNDSEVEEFSTNASERSDYMESFRAIDIAAHPKGSFEFTINKDRYIAAYSTATFGNWLAIFPLHPIRRLKDHKVKNPGAAKRDEQARGRRDHEQVQLVIRLGGRAQEAGKWKTG